MSSVVCLAVEEELVNGKLKIFLKGLVNKYSTFDCGYDFENFKFMLEEYGCSCL